MRLDSVDLELLLSISSCKEGALFYVSKKINKTFEVETFLMGDCVGIKLIVILETVLCAIFVLLRRWNDPLKRC